MKRFWKVIMLLALVAVICLPGMGLAALIYTGDPLLTGSWAQRFQEDGNYSGSHYDFDKIESFMMGIGPGYAFVVPGMGNFSVGGWTGSRPNPQYTVATGSAPVGYIQWDYSFLGAQSDPFHIDYFAYSNNSIIGYATIDWNGLGWSYGANVHDSTGGDYNRSPVPIPAAAWLLGSGLVGLVAIRRRVRS